MLSSSMFSSQARGTTSCSLRVLEPTVHDYSTFRSVMDMQGRKADAERREDTCMLGKDIGAKWIWHSNPCQRRDLSSSPKDFFVSAQDGIGWRRDNTAKISHGWIPSRSTRHCHRYRTWRDIPTGQNLGLDTTLLQDCQSRNTFHWEPLPHGRPAWRQAMVRISVRQQLSLIFILSGAIGLAVLAVAV